MRYYICYDKEDKTIWGRGNTRKEAMEEGVSSVNDYADDWKTREVNVDNIVSSLQVVECTKELFGKLLFGSSYDSVTKWKIKTIAC